MNLELGPWQRLTVISFAEPNGQEVLAMFHKKLCSLMGVDEQVKVLVEEYTQKMAATMPPGDSRNMVVLKFVFQHAQQDATLWTRVPCPPAS